MQGAHVRATYHLACPADSFLLHPKTAVRIPDIFRGFRVIFEGFPGGSILPQNRRENRNESVAQNSERTAGIFASEQAESRRRTGEKSALRKLNFTSGRDRQEHRRVVVIRIL
jgi:hypothetical protein